MSDQAQRISAMRTGGKLLGKIKRQLQEFTRVGMSFAEINVEAERLIAAAGAKANFALVPKYHWATCIMHGDELCHGIPTAAKKVLDGDLLRIDVGLLYDGFHLDTSISFIVGKIDPKIERFLAVGQKALDVAIAQARPGNSVYDISYAMQSVIDGAGYGSVFQLTGHGIGKELHEDPAIPCIALRADKKNRLQVGQTLAIETMYTMGNPLLVLDDDGWTYRTKDGSLGGMIEETVLITEKGPEILTKTE
jgi:methionyl aminopeptidase